MIAAQHIEIMLFSELANDLPTDLRSTYVRLTFDLALTLCARAQIFGCVGGRACMCGHFGGVHVWMGAWVHGCIGDSGAGCEEWRRCCLGRRVNVGMERTLFAFGGSCCHRSKSVRGAGTRSHRKQHACGAILHTHGREEWAILTATLPLPSPPRRPWASLSRTPSP